MHEAEKAETLIFDLDGTISDPFVGISRSVNYALESMGHAAVDPERIRPMIGPPLTDMFLAFLGDIDERHMLALVDKYRERYARTGYRENRLYDDIDTIVHTLHGKGYTLGVCTSKRVDYATRIVEMFGLGPCFAFVDGGDVGVRKASQLRNLVANGLDARRAVMIGDRAVDIEAGKANGIPALGVLWGFGSRDELAGADADLLLETPHDLAAAFT